MRDLGDIPEWLILDEWWNEIGLSWAEHQAEYCDKVS